MNIVDLSTGEKKSQLFMIYRFLRVRYLPGEIGECTSYWLLIKIGILNIHIWLLLRKAETAYVVGFCCCLRRTVV